MNIPMILFQLANTGIIIIIAGIAAYMTFLMIKLARRGIVALDLYIEEKKNSAK